MCKDLKSTAKKLTCFAVAVFSIIVLLVTQVSAVYVFKLTGNDNTAMANAVNYVDTVVANDMNENGNLQLGDLASDVGELGVASKQLFTTNGNNEWGFNYKVYKGLSKKNRKKAMNAFAEGIQMETLSVDAKQKISHAISEVEDGYSSGILNKILEGTKADTIGAMQKVAEYVPTVRTVMGVLIVVGSFWVVFMTVIDIIYVNVPVFQTFFPPDKREGLVPVTRTAQSAVAEVNANNNYGMATLVYLKKQVPFYIVSLIIVGILITGRTGDFIQKVLSLFVH